VLLVEDDALVRMTVRAFLEDAGHRVFEAERGDEVERVLDDAGPIHVVLSDMVLPGFAGPEVVRRVRARHPDARAIYMSAYSRDLLIERGSLLPEQQTLQKPFDERALRLAIEEAFSVEREPQPELVAEKAGPRTVLLVEDYQLARGAMRELLEDEGYRVLEAASLQDARALAHEPIDLLLTDLGLGDGRGDELAEELRAVIPGLGVLYVTGQSATDERVRQALTRPRTRHLQKPVGLAVLAAEVESLLRT
jgi:DNA-binding response OmpR family regulator